MDNMDLEEFNIEWDEDSWDIDHDPEGLLWLIIVICWLFISITSAVIAIAKLLDLNLDESTSNKIGNPSKDLIYIRMRSHMEQLNKLLHNDIIAICTIRMDMRTFGLLCNLLRHVGLKETRFITIEEIVAVFLNICAHCMKNRYQSTN